MATRSSLSRLQAYAVPTRRALFNRFVATSIAGVLPRRLRRPELEIGNDLRVFLDDPKAAMPSSSTAIAPTGLFMHSNLRQPEDFIPLALSTIHRAKAIVQRISNARSSGPSEMRNVVRNFDRLSDVLCSVIDLAELIRHTHPDPSWVAASNDAYEKLCSYMNTLNTHTGLYEVLVAVVNDKGLSSRFTAEERAVAMIFLRDFERSGIDLPPPQRAKFVELSDEILQLGRRFLMDGGGERGEVRIPMSTLSNTITPQGQHYLHSLGKRASRLTGKVSVQGGTSEAQIIMRYCSDAQIRKDVYMASNPENTMNVETLEALLRARDKLANVVGKGSFAEMTLNDKMAKSPDNVMRFLRVLGHHHRPSALIEIMRLRDVKAARESASTPPTIHLWDREFFAGISSSPVIPSSRPLPISVGSVFSGLSELFKRLFGLSFRLTEIAAGEVWHPDVKKLEVSDEDGGVIGWIYADLFGRGGKPHGAAHYTVRCSRRVDKDDWLGDLAHQDPTTPLSGFPEMENGSLLTGLEPRLVRNKEGLYQLPIAVLSCDFAKPSMNEGPTMLTWPEVETLFHEMGHALHSMLGRTEFHNVAGTRCATDFVELPSILMEHFLASGPVQSLLTNSPTTSPVISSPSRGTLPAIDAHTQIILATLDQLYHSSKAGEQDFSSSKVLAELQDSLGIFPSVPGTAWQTHFSHLYGYGATYYSYLFDQAIASRVWSQLFESDPLNREMGERYKNEVLIHGGGKEPWEMVGRLLLDPMIEVGDHNAMEAVGRWGVDHSTSTQTL